MIGEVRIVEVGPRDGLQNESSPIPTATKLALIDRLGDVGLRTIEAGAFVSPKWVPQMADTPEVLARLRRWPGIAYPVLVPNDKGLDAAIAAGVGEIAVFGAASESFSRRNINCTIAESLDRFRPVVARAIEAGIRVRGYVSCVVGCPYEGAIGPEAVRRVAGDLAGMGCYEVSLGDTIGVGTPASVNSLLDAVLRDLPADRVAVHFHDTYGQALVNIHAALQKGIRVIDSSVAGLGGCPYAKGATGNVATEDVVYMLHGMGHETGVDLPALARVGAFIADAIGRSNRSRAGVALMAKDGDPRL